MAERATHGQSGGARSDGRAKTMMHRASAKVQKTRVTCHVVSCDTLFARGNIEREFTQGCTCTIAFYCESYPLAELKASAKELDV